MITYTVPDIAMWPPTNTYRSTNALSPMRFMIEREGESGKGKHGRSCLVEKGVVVGSLIKVRSVVDLVRRRSGPDLAHSCRVVLHQGHE